MKAISILSVLIFYQFAGWSQESSSIENVKVCNSNDKVTLFFDLVNISQNSYKYYIPKDIDACVGLLKLYSDRNSQILTEIPICDYILDLDSYEIDSTNILLLKSAERKRVKIIFKDHIIVQSFKKFRYKNLYIELNYNVLRDFIDNSGDLYKRRIISEKARI